MFLIIKSKNQAELRLKKGCAYMPAARVSAASARHTKENGYMAQ